MSGPTSALSAAAPLAGEHDVEPFDCGEPPLDAWIKRRARANQASGASRTYVVCEGRRVVAYSALASGAVAIAAASSRLKCNATFLEFRREKRRPNLDATHIQRKSLNQMGNWRSS